MSKKRLVIHRLKDHKPEQTPGTMVVMDMSLEKVDFSCVTLELPWKGNMRRISCIPKGIYPCKKRKSSKTFNYEHILVMNIPGRSGVCIHIINFSRQLLGCVGVGRKFVDLDKDGLKDITSSGDTLKELLSYLPNEFELEIK